MFGNINAIFDTLSAGKCPKALTLVCGTKAPEQKLYVHAVEMDIWPYGMVFLPLNYSVQFFVLRDYLFTCELVIYSIF